MTREEIKSAVRRILDFTIADAQHHNSYDELSAESVGAIMALFDDAQTVKTPTTIP